MSQPSIPDAWAELPGEWRSELTASMLNRNMSGIVYTQRIRPGYKIGGWLPVTNELLEDASSLSVEDMALHLLDRHFRPWLYPDRYEWPMIEPFPRAARFLVWFRRRLRRHA